MFPDALIYQYVQHFVKCFLLKSTNLVSTFYPGLVSTFINKDNVGRIGLGH
jgi:hypothetical protein